MSLDKFLQSADCEMEVVCGKKWEDLDETDVDGIHFCMDCKKSVFYTETPAELRVAAERGLCVYIAPGSLAEKNRLSIPERSFSVSRERIQKIEAKALKNLGGQLMGSVVIKKQKNENDEAGL